MKIPISAYLKKEYIIDDEDARIRNPNNLRNSLKYKAGDHIPPNSKVGEYKLFPDKTKVKITAVEMDSKRKVYVHAVPIGAPDSVLPGWTSSSNLQGKFLNEVIAYKPKELDLEPTGNNFTVVDNFSLIRTGKPDYESTGKVIPEGTYVEITARSNEPGEAGKYVRIRHLTIENGEMVAGDPIGWTVFSNLYPGNSKIFASKEWQNKQGDNAAWKSGKFIGAKILVGIVGTKGQLQYIDLNTFEPYWELMETAKKDNITLSINSGFRTYAKQKSLRDGYDAGLKGFNLAAKPGRSNHQNGIAFDLNTNGFDGTPEYDWLKENATGFGFLRTVNGEHWHWEYDPEKAEAARKKDTFKLTRVKK